MAAAVDPTYPLYPIACILSAAMILLVLLTNFVRQTWNLGISFLCFWLFVENLTAGINTIIWADNAEVKLYAYCDIVTHLQVITSVVKPMATFIIARRLYLISDQRPVGQSDKIASHWNILLEWTLGLVIPLIVSGPFYYIVQNIRFEVTQGFGCHTSSDGSILDLVLLWSWTVIPPLLSITVYYPRIARLLYRQSRHIKGILHGNEPMSQANYLRIIALASINILLTLPIGIVSVILAVKSQLSQGPMPLYAGWTHNHINWEPVSQSYREVHAAGISGLAQRYFVQWTSPALAFIIFGLFGVTREARASYWRVIYTVGSWLGWVPAHPTHGLRSTLGDIESGGQPLDTLPDSALRSRPRYLTTGTCTAEQSVGGEEQPRR